MAKTIAKHTISPYSFLRGGQIHADHLQSVIEQQNWSRAYRGSPTYLSVNAAPNYELGPGGSGAWGDAADEEIGLIGLRFSDSATYEIRIDVPIITPPGVTQLRVSARCQMTATHTGVVRFRWFLPPGTSVAGDLSFAAADNGTVKTTTIDISGSASATDHMTTTRLQVLLSRTAGTGAANATVRNILVRADRANIRTPSPDWV